MSREREAIRVAFRANTSPEFDDEITAVFSGVQEWNGRLMCYATIGEHSMCHRDWYTGCTRPATPEEYAPLKRELEGKGYDVTVVQRVKWS